MRKSGFPKMRHYVGFWQMGSNSHFKKFCVPVSTETLKVDKLLKMPSDSISEGVIFQNFLGGIPQIP